MSIFTLDVDDGMNTKTSPNILATWEKKSNIKEDNQNQDLDY